MRKVLVALGLAAAAFGAWAQPYYAPQEFDFSELGRVGAETGMVESVREVPVARDIHAFDPEMLEHTLQRPDTVDEIVIRLDTGYALTLTGNGDIRCLKPGQPVRVIFTTSGPLVEPR